MVDIAYAQAGPGIGGPGPMMTIFPFIVILRHHVFHGYSAAAEEAERASGDAQQTEKETTK